MNFLDVREHLQELIDTYLDDSALQEELLSLLKDGQGRGMKGLIYSLDEHRIRAFSPEDRAFLKDLYFYFC